LDAETGSELLKTKLLGPVDSSPAISENIAYVGSDDRAMYAIDLQARTNAPWPWMIERSRWLWDHFYLWGIAPEPPPPAGWVWGTKSRGAITAASAIAGDTVYFGSQDGRLYALEAATGKERWQFKAAGAISSSPAVVGDVIYFGSDTGYLYAIDRVSGTKLWDFATGGRIMASPAVVKGVIYIGSTDGVFYAIE
jgi:outer membrane protein assembly factor BamB